MAMMAVLAEFPGAFWLFARPLAAPPPLSCIVFDTLYITRELSIRAAAAGSAIPFIATFTFGY